MRCTPQVLNNIGQVQEARGHYAEALATYKRALLIREARLGPNCADTAKVQLNVSHMVIKVGGSLEAAERQLRQVLEELAHPPSPRSSIMTAAHAVTPQ